MLSKTTMAYQLQNEHYIFVRYLFSQSAIFLSSKQWPILFFAQDIVSLMVYDKIVKKYRVSQTKLYIILNLYKLTLRYAMWKIFPRYKKPSLRNIFGKFQGDITTLSVFIKIWIYQVK